MKRFNSKLRFISDSLVCADLRIYGTEDWKGELFETASYTILCNYVAFTYRFVLKLPFIKLTNNSARCHLNRTISADSHLNVWLPIKWVLLNTWNMLI
jgi:hypothetical protein